MKKVEIVFPSGQLSLEGILSIPEGSGPFPAVIVCHPHPLYGGSMDNNVVNSLVEAVARIYRSVLSVLLLLSAVFLLLVVGGRVRHRH